MSKMIRKDYLTKVIYIDYYKLILFNNPRCKGSKGRVK